MNLALFKKKKSNKGIYRQMRGFIAPKHRSADGSISQYQILSENGQNVLIESKSDVSQLICRSCYQRVTIGGFYSKYTNTIKPLYVFKTAKPLDDDRFPHYISNECEENFNIPFHDGAPDLKPAV